MNWAKTSFSESFPELWLFGLGGLFIAVVLIFPNGIAGLWQSYIAPRLGPLFGGAARRTTPPAATPPAAPSPGTAAPAAAAE